MKTDMRIVVGLMIAVVVAGVLFLMAQNPSDEQILENLNPDSYDMETTCIKKDGQYIICNEGNVTFFVYEDVDIYLKSINTIVKENGDEETTVNYKTASLSQLEESIEENGTVLLNLWLTDRGNIKTIMIVENTFVNRNATLKNLEGLDPGTYQSTNMVLSVDKKGLKLAPVNYTDEEKDKFAELINSYAFAKDVKFYLSGITITTDEEGNERKNMQYVKLDRWDILRLDKGALVHIWFNEDGEIDNVLVLQEKRSES